MRLPKVLQTLVTLGTYGVPLGIAGVLLALNTGHTGEGLGFVSTKWAGLFWLSVAALVGYLVLLCLSYGVNKANRREAFWVPLIATGVIVLVALLVFEVALRFVVKPHPFGRQLGELVIKPYEWETARTFNQGLYANSLDSDAYYVGHPTLGWTVGKSRTSKDGLYASSVEGLRSKTQGQELLGAPHETRIALFGDSFMFSEEVGYEDSLAFHLESALGDAYQIVNFGVPGYGVDQAYRRFSEEVDAWSPDVAILGFIGDDLYRAVNVYAFMKPSWGIPFSKPRYVPAGDALEVLNVPNIEPERMFAAQSISELPHLEHDVTYFDFDWQRTVVHKSMLFRALISVFPRFPPDRASMSDAAIAEIGARLTADFVKLATERNVKPVVVYLPSSNDFAGGGAAIRNETLSKAAERGVEVVDVTDCLTDKLDEDALFVEHGVHYSGEGNRIFAQCLIGLFQDSQ